MSVNVYAWPPVSLTGWSWTVSDPVERSESLLTGASYLSAAQRRRRMATMDVSGVSRNRMGAGYMESLKVFLQGGLHLVRLYSMPISLITRHSIEDRQSLSLEWSSEDGDLDWSASGTELFWYSGTPLTGTTGTDAAGFATVTVEGLPPNALVARPSEFLTIFANADDAVGVTVRIVTAAVSDASGVAVVRVFESPGAFADARVNLGTCDTAVFRPVDMPTPPQMLATDWTYTWEFREVFADEVGGFVEVDPW
ncbi:hypothetical protein [Salipiger thiooxidans]|uniref:hypothetical protein n=1 Tax=Salipiger thiooxidans TaxID=282683 RepID=UPI001CFBF1BF|nr:hypothetical protein [Salipiger thiooxidans]